MRVRKPVKTYTIKQAEEEESLCNLKALSKKRKIDEDEDIAERPIRQISKKARISASVDDDGTGETAERRQTRGPIKGKAKSSKPKGALTGSSWYACAAGMLVQLSVVSASTIAL